MKILSLLFLLLMHLQMTGQQVSGKKTNTGKDNLLTVGAEIPIGDFSNTHLFGIGIEYLRSKSKFGIISDNSKGKIAFVYGGGAAVYIGKKETISFYSYKYPAYFFMKATAGFLYKPGLKSGFTITAGPAIGMYDGNSQFNLTGKMDGSYFISEKMAITPGIILMKEMTVADPLVAFSLKVSWAL